MSKATASGCTSRTGHLGGRGRQVRRSIWLIGALVLVVAVGAAALVDRLGVAPRTFAPYIEKRTSGHNPAIEAAGRFASRTLLTLDRGAADMPPAMLAARLGVQRQPAGMHRPVGKVVATPYELRAVFDGAQAGDIITLLPGTYRFADKVLDANRPGRADAPIVVRAATPGTVHIEFDVQEGVRVSAPWWRFENLDIRGVCQTDTFCEHAFHVVGKGRHFASVNNTITDFNAHFKINGVDDDFPDDGLIESNTLSETHIRNTSNPVTPIDLVAASHWVIRMNVIKDFAKAEGNRVSYGAFAKGGGSANLFEGNLIWCEHALRGQAGQRIGLSFGGGGTGADYCRDRKCITEQEGSIMRANLIASCSDAGIYLNSAANSVVEDNTLIDNNGIDVRFATSSARLSGNLVDGSIRSRDGGLLHDVDNDTTPLWQAFIGYHPVRSMFKNALQGDFSWRGAMPMDAMARRRTGLCGADAGQAHGAFDSYAACQYPLAERPLK